MPYANPDEAKAFFRRYTSAENVWRPYIFRTDLPGQYIKALRIQSSIDESTLSGVISRYVKEGLSRDGRLKVSAE